MTIFAAIWSHALKFVFYYPLDDWRDHFLLEGT